MQRLSSHLAIISSYNATGDSRSHSVQTTRALCQRPVSRALFPQYMHCSCGSCELSAAMHVCL